jgi:F0F1-type ATP synthase assembly protein I
MIGSASSQVSRAAAAGVTRASGLLGGLLVGVAIGAIADVHGGYGRIWRKSEAINENGL